MVPTIFISHKGINRELKQQAFLNYEQLRLLKVSNVLHGVLPHDFQLGSVQTVRVHKLKASQVNLNMQAY